jgi:hypothetical protein
MDALQGVIRQNAEKKSHKSLSFIIIATFKLLSINRIIKTGTVTQGM